MSLSNLENCTCSAAFKFTLKFTPLPGKLRDSSTKEPWRQFAQIFFAFSTGPVIAGGSREIAFACFAFERSLMVLVATPSKQRFTWSQGAIYRCCQLLKTTLPSSEDRRFEVTNIVHSSTWLPRFIAKGQRLEPVARASRSIKPSHKHRSLNHYCPHSTTLQTENCKHFVCSTVGDKLQCQDLAGLTSLQCGFNLWQQISVLRESIAIVAL